MVFPIPVYVEESRGDAANPSTVVARPVFAPVPVQRGHRLGRVLARLTHDLHQHLRTLAAEARHDELARWTFSPSLDSETVELRLDLASGSHRCHVLLAGYAALGRKVWFTPVLPDLAFEVLPGQSLAERATATFTRHLRERERQGATVPGPGDIALHGRGHLTVVEVTLDPVASRSRSRRPARALLFGGEERKDGEVELRATGRALHLLPPDELGRALGREREVEELARLLAAPDRRPVVLVGPRQVGKTAILQDLVRRLVERRRDRPAGAREVWHLSPMRLVSGMSVLGEWESRVLAILEHARDRDLALYFDDLPGLFAAGSSSASDLNVARVLAPTLEQRAVRVIGETTPEAWRVLRERDRAFADLFHVIPIVEPTEDESLRVLVHLVRQLEREHRCEFDLPVVPRVCELLRRHAPDAAFPGKAARFLQRLATRHAGATRPIGTDDVQAEFHEQTGLPVTLLDGARLLTRDDLRRHHWGVVGQDAVLEAFADVLVRLKAGLNDPRRPLAALLLLGPTGVGKTQSAKALASYLFGSPDRLLRFDMNEFVQPASVARLTGTPAEPEGLLTGALRRQPFAVVLFDEIEKAAPEVFDLLLAVLDEGRLTDSLGRVADFTQSVILLTSNLGARESRSRLGFRPGSASGPDSDSDSAVYTEAARQFFRPEFFNRLDGLVPFRPLAADDLHRITAGLLSEVLRRNGLERRRVLFEASPGARARLTELGFHPEQGARALKRVIERELVQPLAVELAARPIGTPLIANLETLDGRFVLGIRDLLPVPRSIRWPETVAQVAATPPWTAWVESLLAAARAALRRLERDLEPAAPTGAVELGTPSTGPAWYFRCREQFHRVTECLRRLELTDAESPTAPTIVAASSKRPTKIIQRHHYGTTVPLDRQREADRLASDLADLSVEDASESAPPDGPIATLLRELALAQALATRPVLDEDRLLAFLPEAGELPEPCREFLRDTFEAAFAAIGGFSATLLEPDNSPTGGRPESASFVAFHLRGPNVGRLFPEGTEAMLVRGPHLLRALVGRHGIRVGSESDARQRIRELASGAANPAGRSASVPLTHELVHTLGDPGSRLMDHRTGLAATSAEELRIQLVATLPLPAELEPILASPPASRAAPPASESPTR